MNKLRDRPLTRELIAALLIKLILIGGLWLVFFRHPADSPLRPADVSRAIFSDHSPFGSPSGRKG